MQLLVSPGLLALLTESFPADIVGMANKSPDQRAQIIGEQRVVETIRHWAAEEDPLQDE
jgi:hypothetical protein